MLSQEAEGRQVSSQGSADSQDAPSSLPSPPKQPPQSLKFLESPSHPDPRVF